ncbi:LexA family protein [Ralstonia pseudosolanacearum]
MNQKSLPLPGERSACPSFTDKQGQYLAFIWAYSLINGRAPAERDMQRFFGATPPSVHQMVLNLERDGLLRRQAGIARSIELLVDHNCLPVLQPTQTVITSGLRY